MVVSYSTKSNWNILTQTHGSKRLDILPYCLLNVVWMILLTIYNEHHGNDDDPVVNNNNNKQQTKVEISNQGHVFTTMIVSFLLVTRVNASLSRYHDASTAVMTLCGTIREFITNIYVYTKDCQSHLDHDHDDDITWRHEIIYRALLLLRTSMAVIDYPETKQPAYLIPELNGYEYHDIHNHMLLVLQQRNQNQQQNQNTNHSFTYVKDVENPPLTPGTPNTTSSSNSDSSSNNSNTTPPLSFAKGGQQDQQDQQIHKQKRLYVETTLCSHQYEDDDDTTTTDLRRCKNSNRSATRNNKKNNRNIEYEETIRVPIRVAYLVRQSLVSQTHRLSTPLGIQVELKLMTYIDIYMNTYNNTIRKYITAPVPFPLIQMARTILFLFVYTIPFVFLSDKSNLVVHCIAVFIITYGFIGLEIIAIELDDPFGSDTNDIDNLQLSNNVNDDVYLMALDVDGIAGVHALRNRMNLLSTSTTEQSPNEHTATRTPTTPQQQQEQHQYQLNQHGNTIKTGTIHCPAAAATTTTTIVERRSGDWKKSPSSIHTTTTTSNTYGDMTENSERSYLLKVSS